MEIPAATPQSRSYPVTLEVQYPERSSRLWALGTLLLLIPKMVALLPHLIALYLLGFFMIPVFLFSQVAVLLTGRYPRQLFDFLVGILRWQLRVNAFLFGLTDEYPPFQLR